MRISGDISICYSGGLDSTYTALLMAKNTQSNIHLLTYIHDYGTLFPGWSEIHVRELRSLFGDERIIHSYHNITDIFKEITVNRLFKDWRRYNGHFIWCLGCVLAMATRTIIYNLQHCIPNVMFCSSTGGEYAVMSTPVTIAEEKIFYKQYGISFHAPLLELKIAKPQERKALKENKLWLGIRFRRGHHGIQPICIPGFQHIGDVLFDLHTIPNSKNIQRFISDKMAVMRSIIEAYFKERNMDIQGLIDAINRQRERCKESEIRAV